MDRRAVTGPTRSRLWRRVNGVGLERFELLRGPDGWTLRGTVLADASGDPVEACYEIACDGAWRTLRADVRLRDGAGARDLAIAVAAGRWTLDGREEASLRGCVDVDLGWSPSTNTLPIRRLRLAPGGASGPILAAWVRFPELTVEPLEQEYRCLAEGRYRYTSRGGAFSAVLEVDGEGWCSTTRGCGGAEERPVRRPALRGGRIGIVALDRHRVGRPVDVHRERLEVLAERGRAAPAVFERLAASTRGA